jgi:hypothetical protein
MITVKIDRSTIKKNNNFTGQYQILGPVTYEKTEVTTRKYVSLNNENWLLQSENTETNVSSSQPITRLYDLGRSNPYNYSYEPTEVKCEYCEKSFLHTELKSDWVESYNPVDDSDGGGYYDEYERVNICPHCNMSECCELEYEKFSKDILEEVPL